MRIEVKRRLLIVIVLGSMTQSPSAVASNQAVRENPLTSVTRLRCHFTTSTGVVWKGGKPDVRTEPVDLRLTISEINIQEGTAEASGPQGRRLVTAVLSDGTLSLMETARGAVDLTTVFATESSPGKFKAVRAQHAYVFLTVPPFDENPTVAQSYGDCEPLSDR
jgi:hypothetical protein